MLQESFEEVEEMDNLRFYRETRRTGWANLGIRLPSLILNSVHPLLRYSTYGETGGPWSIKIDY